MKETFYQVPSTAGHAAVPFLWIVADARDTNSLQAAAEYIYTGFKDGYRIDIGQLAGDNIRVHSHCKHAKRLVKRAVLQNVERVNYTNGSDGSCQIKKGKAGAALSKVAACVFASLLRMFRCCCYKDVNNSFIVGVFADEDLRGARLLERILGLLLCSAPFLLTQLPVVRGAGLLAVH